MTSHQIRKTFLDFFAARGHAVRPSDRLIPSHDPTLLFTSAGMVPFKEQFLATGPLPFTRAASSQKCFRTTDIDRVGHTARHLTFFEMLGNFSFGDYFKAEAIPWAWEFLTGPMRLGAARLYPTIYKEDEEAAGIWAKVAPGRPVTRLGKDSNFWEMGPTGPCGPCSEILYDRGTAVGCGHPHCAPGCPCDHCDRYTEIWNLVFTQFDKQPDGFVKPLPKRNIDTGMGLERLAAVVQNVPGNFHTDLLKPLVDAAADMARARFGADPRVDAALRVLADHSRAGAMLVADGVLPSNEGRGYVLRRVLRRAVRAGSQIGIREAFLHTLAGKVVDLLGEPYPELRERREHLARVIKMEEEQFRETLETGSGRLRDVIAAAQKSARKRLSGQELFELYDTYGFPMELTRDLASEAGLSVDEPGFGEALEAQRARSRQAWKGSGDKDAGAWAAFARDVGPTTFRGYETLACKARVKAVLREKDEDLVILDETPFYGEAGGQSGDTGWIIVSGMKVDVIDTRKHGESLTIHVCRDLQKVLEVGKPVEAVVDAEKRRRIRRGHTATHLLHAALRRVMGEHVTQAGSLVLPNRLRLDFSHGAALTPEEISRVEDLVNQAIWDGQPVHTTVTSQAEARKLGALAFFGDKYGDQVRVVSVDPLPTERGEGGGEGRPFSMEFCGGTHCASTWEIGFFRILTESSIAAGVRRIEAVTAEEAVASVRDREGWLFRAAAALNTAPADLHKRIDVLMHERKQMERALEKHQSAAAVKGAADLVSKAVKIGPVSLIAANLGQATPQTLRTVGDEARSKLALLGESATSAVIVLGGTDDGKAAFVVMVTPDLVKQGWHAGEFANALAEAVGGSGGGRPEMAQAGGRQTDRIDAALARIRDLIQKKAVS